jgi:hypothetical protein
MVLVDTSIWVSHLRISEPHLKTLLDAAGVLCHPFVIGELACGNLKPRQEILSLLSTLPSAPAVSQEEVLLFVERQSLAGTGIGFVDAHLLASARLIGVPLWTADLPLKRAAERLTLSYVS